MNKILITICARGGSKGIPGKNIKMLADKPLIAYTINIAKSFQKRNSHVHIALSTDSESIKSIAAKYGLNTFYSRPAHLANDIAGKIGVIEDVLLFEEKRNKTNYEYIIDLDITSPLRTLQDIEESLLKIITNSEALNIFSVSDSIRNPYFNMVEKKDKEFYKVVKSAPDGIPYHTRQSAPKVFDMNASFYIYRRSFFNENIDSVITIKSLIFVLQHMCFDLDHPIDFEFLEFLIVNGKLDFEL